MTFRGLFLSQIMYLESSKSGFNLKQNQNGSEFISAVNSCFTTLHLLKVDIRHKSPCSAHHDPPPYSSNITG